MSKLDARLERGYSAVWSLDRSLPMPAPAGTFNRRQSEMVSPAQPAAAVAIGKTGPCRVAFVESNQYYREVLTFELLRQGFVVHAFADGASLLGSLASAVDADLAVLDWDLPKMPGIKLLAELRQHGLNLPVVFLTGEVIAGDEHDRCVLAPRETLNANEIMAFDHGAVDFIVKSRGRQVLVRRLKSVAERVKLKPKTDLPVEERLTCDKLVLAPKSSRVYWNEVDVGLTLGEYNIVHLLASNAGRWVTYRAIYDRVHYEGFIGGSGEDGYRINVRGIIKRIRGKFLQCDETFAEIDNFVGLGYRWASPTSPRERLS